MFSSSLAIHHYIALHLHISPELLSIGWSSIGLPSDHTFIQEDDIEAIDSMGTLGIKSHHYGDTWVSNIFVQQNVFNEYYSYVYYILCAKDCSEKDPRGRLQTISQNIFIHLGTIYVDKTDIYLGIQDTNGVKTRVGEEDLWIV